jgi:hypothetical protein
MTIQEQQQAGYITLKEASELFGYTPDYIGQLIRKGRIEGKQVYANVAWMTTEASIKEYLSREKSVSKTEGERPLLIDRATKAMFSEKGTPVLVWILRAAIVALVVVFMFVFYFLSIAIDHKLARNAERMLEYRSALQQVPTTVLKVNDHITYDK